MNINILIILSCICMLFVLGKIFIVPIKWITKLAVNSILGGVLIWIINMIGGFFGFHIGINVYTSFLVGILGVPGAILLIIIKILVRMTICKFVNLGSVLFFTSVNLGSVLFFCFAI